MLGQRGPKPSTVLMSLLAACPRQVVRQPQIVIFMFGRACVVVV